MKGPGTSVRLSNGKVIRFKQRLTTAQARNAVRRMLERGRMNPVNDLGKAVKKFAQFNGKPAKTVTQLPFSLKTKWFGLGTCPEIHYLSGKEGKLMHYYHKVREPGNIYMSVDGRYFLIANRTTVARGKWLHELGGEVR